MDISHKALFSSESESICTEERKSLLSNNTKQSTSTAQIENIILEVIRESMMF